MNITDALPPVNIIDQTACTKTLTLYATGHAAPDEPSNRDHIDDYIQSELQAPVLNELAPYLWLLSRRSGCHIDPVHKQLCKRREVLITEDPGLHLVWHDNIIYVKPIPLWLFCSDVWDRHLIGTGNRPLSPELSSDLTKSAVGFLRSYSWLIRHPSDFHLAQQMHLIPKGIDVIDFEAFISNFRSFTDAAVTQRYHFGQIRLSRLNLTTRVIWLVNVVRTRQKRWRFYYHETRWTASQYFKDYFAVLVAVFAVLSIALSGMQVALAVDMNQRALAQGFWGLSIAVIGICGIVLAVWVLAIVLVLLCQLQFAARQKLHEFRQ